MCFFHTCINTIFFMIRRKVISKRSMCEWKSPFNQIRPCIQKDLFLAAGWISTKFTICWESQAKLVGGYKGLEVAWKLRKRSATRKQYLCAAMYRVRINIKRAVVFFVFGKCSGIRRRAGSTIVITTRQNSSNFTFYISRGKILHALWIWSIFDLSYCGKYAMKM